MDYSMARIETLALETFAALPEPFRANAKDIVLRVEDMPDADLIHAMKLEDPLDLTGLYEGVPLTEKSVMDPSPYPDTIILFRRPILAELAERPEVTLQELVAHVVIHELAHHFGWSDDDIAHIDRWWE